MTDQYPVLIIPLKNISSFFTFEDLKGNNDSPAELCVGMYVPATFAYYYFFSPASRLGNMSESV